LLVLSKEANKTSEENCRKLEELVIKLENDIYMLRSENTEKINHMKEELLVLSKEANKTSEENCRKLEDALNKLQQRDIPLLKKELEKYLRKHEHVDMDYTQFEHKFRGTREEIKRRQAGYLKYFLNKNKVLDIGCGRGEFLELLKESNIDAIGIDLNRENVKYCNEKGLSVVHADAIEYLSQCDNSSLGGVFMSQVAEHLRPNELISIIKLAKKKLQPGAYIIIETINPTALIVFAESYYMDPTHITLVHPLTLKFLIESEGFSNIETLFLSPVEEANRLPKPDQAGLDEIISKLNDLIYGYRDYSVIAKNT